MKKGGKEMPYTYNKLRGKIIEIYGTQGKFAEKLGVSKNSVSKKMNCQTEFSQDDIIRWSMLLTYRKRSIGGIFFYLKSLWLFTYVY